MDLPAFGAAVGAGLASFGASTLALYRAMQKQQRDQPAGKDVDKLRAKLTQVEAAREHDAHTIERLEEQVRRMQERLERAVTDEEFATQSAATTATLHSLTEKVGHVAGAVEAWYRGAGRGGE